MEAHGTAHRPRGPDRDRGAEPRLPRHAEERASARSARSRPTSGTWTPRRASRASSRPPLAGAPADPAQPPLPQPNPKLDFANSPFFVNTGLREWETGGPPRAGVSALGVGGTNAHCVEEGPRRLRRLPAGPAPRAVRAQRDGARRTDRLAAHLRAHPDQDLADVACCSPAATVSITAAPWPPGARPRPRRFSSKRRDAGLPPRLAGQRPVVFMFPGQGAQYPGMTRGLYEAEPSFRARRRLLRAIGPRSAWTCAPCSSRSQRPRRRRGSLLAPPSPSPRCSSIEYALARLWMSWGVKPQAMIGHSVGEYVAAHLAGVMSLEDALALVAERGRLMQSLPGGRDARRLAAGGRAPGARPRAALARRRQRAQSAASFPGLSKMSSRWSDNSPRGDYPATVCPPRTRFIRT